MMAPPAAVTPIMNALVAAAARTGTPHHAFSTGTLMMPPPMPRSDETLPAANDASRASGRRLTRYVTSPLLSASWKRPPRRPGSAVGSRTTFRRLRRPNTAMPARTAIVANRRCNTGSENRWAVNPPSRLPATVATSSTIPRRRLMSCVPLRAAETELDVAITVARLIAAAVLSWTPSARWRSGTRNTPPPIPRSAPTPPATTPDPNTMSASAGVNEGIRLTLQQPELQRLSEMIGADRRRAFQVGNRARDFSNAIIRAGAERQPCHRCVQHANRLAIQGAVATEQPRREIRVRANPIIRVAELLDFARSHDPRADAGRRLACRLGCQRLAG